MMEPSNLGHHHQDQLHASFFHDLGTNHEWSQSPMLNSGGFISNADGVLLSSQRDYRLSHEIPPLPLNSHMVQDLGFHWAGSVESFMNQSAYQLNLAKIKEELPDSFPRLGGVIREPSTIEDYQLEEKLFRTLASDCQINSCQPRSTDLFNDPSLANHGAGRGNLSLVFPTTNISNPWPPMPTFPVSLDMDLEALDLLASARFDRSIFQPLFSGMGLLREDTPFGLGHLHEPVQVPFHGHHKMPSLVGGAADAKRANSILEHKASQTEQKKSRFESRSSISSFKVRKEKLGDRIAALQQLVAPFGKTDTASVLMEAIGYIKFLQDQVETLSVPYLKSSNNKKARIIQEVSNEERDKPKLDLRSRGLCLVPLSCTSYVTNDNGGVWSPPN
ncbi:transcription factor bHLH110 [Elaeis guineensis]|uniref:Transcription factor bHLH110 n=1 Tax=Elaeis guineensis var. tenera TaxID=51953 RepID=A0A6I9S2U3_ELAGV|nr:transcription factor bHLH110 [Elaeis guineensis]XP_019709955.1 transcription factor bHLH110 [Elaeis guineensis]